MGVIPAIAFGLAPGNGGGSSFVTVASPILAALVAIGLWLWGRWRARSAAGADGGVDSPGFVTRVAPELGRRLRLWPTAPSPAPATIPLPTPLADAFSPDCRRARPP